MKKSSFNKLMAAGALSVFTFGLAMPVLAADQIQFTGRVVEESCTLDTTITTGAGTVALGDVPVDDVSESGGKSPDTPFTVALTGCPANDAQISLTLAGTPDTNNTALLAVTPGTGVATGVGIAVADNTSGTAVPLDFTAGAVTAPKSTDASGKVSFDFIANIMNSGAASVTAGDANSVATITVNYE